MFLSFSRTCLVNNRNIVQCQLRCGISYHLNKQKPKLAGGRLGLIFFLNKTNATGKKARSLVSFTRTKPRPVQGFVLFVETKLKPVQGFVLFVETKLKPVQGFALFF